MTRKQLKAIRAWIELIIESREQSSVETECEIRDREDEILELFRSKRGSRGYYRPPRPRMEKPPRKKL